MAYETVSVSSVDEALEQLAKEPSFNLVLADELMPMRGGLDLLTTLRLDSPLGAPAAHPAVLVRAEHDTTSTSIGRMPLA